MAKRYRYAFVKKQEARKGKLSTGLAAASLVLFLAAVMLACVFNGEMGYIVGGISLFAMLLSVYGFSETGRNHRTSMIGSILNGMIMIGWLGMYLLGMTNI